MIAAGLRIPRELPSRHLRRSDECPGARLIRALACPYHRVQADPDHVHGGNLLHATVMLDAAPGTATLNGRHWDGTLEGLPGPIAQQGAAIRRVLRGALSLP